MCVIGISDASYHQKNPTIAGAMIMIGNMKNKRTAPVYWKSGVVNRVCTSKAFGDLYTQFTTSLFQYTGNVLLFLTYPVIIIAPAIVGFSWW